MQLQRTGLGVRVHPGCFYWVWGHGTRGDSGGWHLWMQLCVGWKLVKYEGSPQWLCWLMISSVAKAVWVLCRTVPGIVVIPTAQLIPVSPALLVSCCLYVSALLVSWWDEAEVSPLCIAPNGWHWSLTPLSLSRWKDLFLAGKFPRYWAVPAWGMKFCRQSEAVLPLLCVYSQVLCSTVLLKFLKWTPVLSQSYFCSWITI